MGEGVGRGGGMAQDALFAGTRRDRPLWAARPRGGIRAGWGEAGRDPLVRGEGRGVSD